MKKKAVDYTNIISFEKAYESLPKDDEDVVNYDKAKAAGLADHTMAELELIIIIKVVNPEDFKVDFDDTNEKWSPWFQYGQSGFRFVFSYCTVTDSDPGLGSRLCLSDEKRSDFMGKTFLSTYKRFLIK